MTDDATLLSGRSFLEGPRWHDGALWCSDMHGDRVLRVEVDGTVTEVVEVDHPSGLGWLPDGSLLVVSMAARHVLRFDGTALTLHADLSPLAAHEINDMVVDARGHAFVGQFGYDMHGGAAPAPSALLRVDPDGSVHEAAPDLRVANGMVITADGHTLVVAESAGMALTAFTLGADGTLTDRRTWAALPDPPDGIGIDARDGVWCAGPVTDRFVRVVEGGEVTDIVDVPGRHAIACVLGGADGHTLFMLTASTLGKRADSQAAMSAAVETTRVDVPGRT